MHHDRYPIIFFCPCITANMNRGRSTEFEVKIGKGCITGQQQDGNDEMLTNAGYFYVTGLLLYGPEDDWEYDDGKATAATVAYKTNYISYSNQNNQLITNIAPFAKLLLHTHTHLY